MKRRNFLSVLPASAFPLLWGPSAAASAAPEKSAFPAGEKTDRNYWLGHLKRLAEPVLTHLAEGRLKEKIPQKTVGDRRDVNQYARFEAFSRLVVGLAPWLELEAGDKEEKKLRQRYRELARKGIERGFNPDSPDYFNLTEGAQPLVEMAFMAHAVLRAPTQLYEKLPETTRNYLVEGLKKSRDITPYYNNWQLFSAMIESFFRKWDLEVDEAKIWVALQAHMQWYAGDGTYGDGPHFHWDYYNSYVIQPMMLDVYRVMEEKTDADPSAHKGVRERATRYAAVQERLIGPDGTYPPIGRSLTYRCGAFQHLAQCALQGLLPEALPPEQVRAALSAVIARTLGAEGTYDQAGWLTIGLAGEQPSIGEFYISYGSPYLCSAVFLPLGLAPEHDFWAKTPKDWTAKRVWSGQENIPIDKAYKG